MSLSVAKGQSASSEKPAAVCLSQRAQALLLSSPYHAVRRVSCALDNGRLVLEGRLPSFFFKQMAQETVAELQDVGRVINRIEVIA